MKGAINTLTGESKHRNYHETPLDCHECGAGARFLCPYCTLLNHRDTFVCRSCGHESLGPEKL